VGAECIEPEKVAVMSAAEQHGLPSERNAGLSVLEDMVGDIARLRCLVLGADQVKEVRPDFFVE
jgi:hypothetical protein